MIWLVCWCEGLGKMLSWGPCLSAIFKYLKESGLRLQCSTWWDAFGPWAIFDCLFSLKRKPPANLAANDCLKSKRKKAGKELVKQWRFWALLCSSSSKFGSASHGEGLMRMQELSFLRAGVVGADLHAFNSYTTVCSLEGWLACTALSLWLLEWPCVLCTYAGDLIYN